MEHQWPVEVVDEADRPITGARICLLPSSMLSPDSSFPHDDVEGTHDDLGGGKYEPSAPIEPSAGDWLLVVSADGRSPVVQRLTLTKKGKEELGAAPRKGALATVKITGLTRAVGGSKVKVTTFRIKMYPSSQIVYIGGTDYNRRDVSGGWLFHLYAFHRAEVLRKEKKIDPGTIVTVFSTAKITKITRVFGQAGWVEVEVKSLGDTKARVLPAKGESYKPVVGLDIHIQDFYRYIAEIGSWEPGTVKEIGIFSHSWPGGPILYNSWQREPYASGAGRDPEDFDARSKDFNATNLKSYPAFKAALAPDCRFTIWGCSATTHYKNRTNKALEAMDKGKKEDEMFIVNTSISHDHGAGGLASVTEERVSELRHRWMMDQVFRRGTYPAAAAAALGIEVRSACPGCGSDPKKVGGIEFMGVDVVTYARIFRYYQKKFGPEFAETKGTYDKGYVDYHKLQSRPPVPAPPFSSEYYDYTIDHDDKQATLSFWNDKGVTHPGVKGKLKATAVSGLAVSGKKGHLYVIKDPDDTLTQAVYVQEDGRVYTVTRDAAGAWTEIGDEL